ncbi:hypothetical protein M569_14991 [Genlisea aurea]|uniref:Protein DETOXIFICATION n=1 Tax=Genlisea aurea TaxID=192259 RepID=S8DAT8_9LAMI|nr:hypothetical protein M569_14991 [Genlisea aurea]
MEAAAEPLLEEGNSEKGKSSFLDELNKVICIAMPMVVVSVSQYMLRAVSMMMLGHLGELALSSAALAISLSNVTGFILLIGMASSLETLCGQAYGAGRYERVGILTYGSIIWLSLACFPVCILWFFTGELLLWTGQDPLISKAAGNFSVWLIPSLFPYAILQSLIRYLQVQSLIAPMVITSLASLCIHVPVSWALVFKLDLGGVGAALSIGISYWLNVIMLLLYIKFSTSCDKTRTAFSVDAFRTFREFFKFAIPSAFMGWTFELVILLSGMLPNPQLETSVLSICSTINTLHFLVSNSIAAGASTRASNAIGSGNHEAVRRVLWAVLLLAVVELLAAVAALSFCRDILGYAFSDEAAVVSYVKDMIPFLCFTIATDGLQSEWFEAGGSNGSGRTSTSPRITSREFRCRCFRDSSRRRKGRACGAD